MMMGLGVVGLSSNILPAPLAAQMLSGVCCWKLKLLLFIFLWTELGSQKAIVRFHCKYCDGEN